MKRIVVSTVISFMCLALAGYVEAAQSNPQQAMQGPASTQQQVPPKFVMSENLRGAAVWSRQGDSLGVVEGIVIDSQSGKVTTLVLSLAPEFKRGDTLVAVPWDRFRITSPRDLTLDADKQTLAKAPAFPKSQMPQFATMEWHQKVYGWWGSAEGAPTAYQGQAPSAAGGTTSAGAGGTETKEMKQPQR